MANMQIPQDIEVTSACYARHAVDGEHSLSEQPLCGKINLRGDRGNTEIVTAITAALSVAPPVVANTKATTGDVTVFWTGPDEWLILCPLSQTDSLIDQLKNQLGQLHHAVTEVSDYYTVLRLSGAQSAALLSRGCPQDLHPDVFPAGAMTQTRFGHASVILDRQQDGVSWDIHVRWTYAEYVWDYLVSAMAALD